MAVSNQDIQQWFASNPNASTDQIVAAAQQYGATPGQIDAAMGFGTQSQDYAAANPEMVWKGQLGQDQINNLIANPVDNYQWNADTSGWFDDAMQAAAASGLSDQQVFDLAQQYGLTPDRAQTMLSGADADWASAGGWRDKSADEIIRQVSGSNTLGVDPALNWAGSYLTDPYAAQAGNADIYSGLASRGFDDSFIESLYGKTFGNDMPAAFTDIKSGNVQAPYTAGRWNENGDWGMRDRLTNQFGGNANINELAQWLYGKNLPPALAQVAAPALSDAARPVTIADDGTASVAMPEQTPGGFDISGSHGIDTSINAQDVGLMGRNWLPSFWNANKDSIMEYANTPGASLEGLDQRFGKPGLANALIRYNPDLGNIFPSRRLNNQNWLNYGSGPQQKLVTTPSGNVNTLIDLMAQRQNTQDTDNPVLQQLAKGGRVGGLQAISRVSKRTKGGNGGQADNVPALLSVDEFVVDADTVAALGDGSSDEGARRLDAMRQNVRKHKRAAPIDKIPPKAKKPEQYMRGSK